MIIIMMIMQDDDDPLIRPTGKNKKQPIHHLVCRKYHAMPPSSESTKPESTPRLPQLPSSEERFFRAWMIVSNFTMMYNWAKCLRTFYRHWNDLQNPRSPVCMGKLTPDARMATVIGFLELFNAMLGATRSNPLQVLLFCTVRAGVEHLVASMLASCSEWQHLLTVFMWSLGDTIRFGCFLLDVLVPGARVAKTIRYTFGPLLFPLGALAEMLMVIKLAQRSGPKILYLVAMLWPVGFYPLMKQLLKQRRKFFQTEDGVKTTKTV